MDSPIMFKTAVGGFDKKAVMSYIFEINETAQAAQRELSDQLSEVSQARNALEDQMAEANRKLQRLQTNLDSVTAELEGEKSRTTQLSEMVDNLNTEVERQRQLVGEKESEANSVNAMTGELQVKYRQLEEKKLEVERASAQIGRLLLDANADADRIRSEAQAQAEEVAEQSRIDVQESLDTANAKAEEITRAAKERSAAIIGDTESSLKNVRNQFALFESEMTGIRRTVEAAAASMTDRVHSIADVIQTADERLEISVYFSEDPSGEDGADLDSHGDEQHGEDVTDDAPHADGESFFRFTADN